MLSCCTGPPPAPPKDKRIRIEQLLDEDFDCMRRMAQGICQTLGRPKDREVCRSTLDELMKFNQVDSLEVKQNVHKFMRFYLKVLRWTQKHQPAEYQQWYGNAFNSTRDNTMSSNFSMLQGSAVQGEVGALGDMRVWLEEAGSYLAMKSFEDGSTIIYAAVAKDPNAGWADNGLKALTQRQCGGERDNA
ncbi:uncharacterized protein LOC115631136 [Scaptodrosophila lebanonensis]|uniref:Uncharacterized protein LOC115631136 n=1 Tax=Drosophila lebanonensis TaxID=7225 RepID=A0A6J2U5M9_DROLE|nr:uncharacterized protein LOC115631136 [Scaptodrosophila lebanonensis]